MLHVQLEFYIQEYMEFLNFRSFSFLKEFFLQKAEGKAWWVVKNVDQEAESVVAGSLDFDFQDDGPAPEWS